MKPLLLILSVSVAASAFADGGMFAPAIHEIFEHEQVALLEWDAGAGVEALSILPGLSGDMREFAWVVPLPAEPQLGLADVAVFDQLFTATSPLYRDRGDGWSCNHMDADYAVGDADNGVDILQQEVLGVYDIMVLAADHASSLVDSLDAWGYLHDGNRATAEPILADYVARDWVFVTMRVDSAAFAESWDDPGLWWSGGTTPVTFTFAADAPVFPMKISAVSASHRTRVSVFAVAGQRLTFPGAETRYANRLDSGEMEMFGERWPELALRLQAGRVLTRLERTMGSADMDSDLILVPSADQGDFRPVRYAGSADFWWFLGPVLVFWGVGRWRAGR